MIQVKAPLRVSFCGGGSDMYTFYSKYGGCVLNTTIDKYIYLNLIDNFDKKETILSYSPLIETVRDFDQIQHDRFRQCLKTFNVFGVNISSLSDVPFGTGLGSSSAFTVALIKLLSIYNNEYMSKEAIAELACKIEIDDLRVYSGKQDQYASSFGGLNFIEFNKDGTVCVNPINLEKSKRHKLENNLCMFYVGGVHNSSDIVRKQIENVRHSKKKQDSLIEMCNITKSLKKSLDNGDISAVGDALKENWEIKKSLSDGITNDRIDYVYDMAVNAGAYSGKLLGAGNAGFMLFYVPNEKRESVIYTLDDIGVKEMPFNFEFDRFNCGVRERIVVGE